MFLIYFHRNPAVRTIWAPIWALKKSHFTVTLFSILDSALCCFEHEVGKFRETLELVTTSQHFAMKIPPKWSFYQRHFDWRCKCQLPHCPNLRQETSPTLTWERFWEVAKEQKKQKVSFRDTWERYYQLFPILHLPALLVDQKWTTAPNT